MRDPATEVSNSGILEEGFQWVVMGINYVIVETSVIKLE